LRLTGGRLSRQRFEDVAKNVGLVIDTVGHDTSD
jgi:hypothetical protein